MMLRIAAFVLLCLGVLGAFLLVPKLVSSAAAKTPAASKHGLIVTDTQVGTGKKAVSGHRVTVNYTGWLFDAKAPQSHGKQFDSSLGREPLEFNLGAREVIPGWERGVAGMKVGGKRTLVIPGSLAYGATGAGDLIPPNATLVFDVELLAVK